MADKQMEPQPGFWSRDQGPEFLSRIPGAYDYFCSNVWPVAPRTNRGGPHFRAHARFRRNLRPSESEFSCV